MKEENMKFQYSPIGYCLGEEITIKKEEFYYYQVDELYICSICRKLDVNPYETT